MSRSTPSLVALTLLSCSLIGCHHPEITLVDREHDDVRVSAPFIKGQTINFPKIDSNGLNYFVIFVDQSPCRLAEGSNPKAYPGTPATPPTCTIDFEPHGRDRLYRYTVYLRSKADDQQTPPLDIPYHTDYSCRPACNGSN